MADTGAHRAPMPIPDGPCLFVTVMEAMNMKDSGGRCDAYVVTSLNDETKSRWQTPISRKSTHGRWGVDHIVPVPAESTDHMFDVKLLAWDRFEADELLGQVRICLADIDTGAPCDLWYHMTKAKRKLGPPEPSIGTQQPGAGKQLRLWLHYIRSVEDYNEYIREENRRHREIDHLLSQVDQVEQRKWRSNFKLYVSVLEAKDLSSHPCDSYVELSCNGDQFTTRAVKKSKTPHWNEEKSYLVEDPSSTYLDVVVRDHALRDHEIGRFSVPTSSLADGEVYDTWYLLHNEATAGVSESESISPQLRLRILFVLDEEKWRKEQDRKFRETPKMLVSVLGAKDVADPRRGKACTPFVEVTVGERTFVTKTIKNATKRPLWHEDHTFLVADPKSSLLNVKLIAWDHNANNELIGSVTIPMDKSRDGYTIDDWYSMDVPTGRNPKLNRPPQIHIKSAWFYSEEHWRHELELRREAEEAERRVHEAEEARILENSPKIVLNVKSANNIIENISRSIFMNVACNDEDFVTHKVSKTHSPQWNEQHVFVLDDEYPSNAIITVTAYEHNERTRDSHEIGHFNVPVRTLELDKRYNAWYTLFRAEEGSLAVPEEEPSSTEPQLNLNLHYVDPRYKESEESLRRLEEEDRQLREMDADRRKRIDTEAQAMLLADTPEYGEMKFWEARYSLTDKPFDWYLSFPALRESIIPYLSESSRILVVGCGSSRLAAAIHDEGYSNVTAIDWSKVVIDQNRKRYEGKDIRWMVMDARYMEFPSQSYDIVIDKACLDAILTSDDASDTNVNLYVKEVGRVLCPGGVYVCISHGAPEDRGDVLQASAVKWAVQQKPLERAMIDKPNMKDMDGCYWCYHLRKEDSRKVAVVQRDPDSDEDLPQ